MCYYLQKIAMWACDDEQIIVIAKFSEARNL